MELYTGHNEEMVALGNVDVLAEAKWQIESYESQISLMNSDKGISEIRKSSFISQEYLYDNDFRDGKIKEMNAEIVRIKRHYNI